MERLGSVVKHRSSSSESQKPASISGTHVCVWRRSTKHTLLVSSHSEEERYVLESVSPSLFVRAIRTLSPFRVWVVLTHSAACLTTSQGDNTWAKKQKHGMPDCREEFCTQIPSHPARVGKDHGFSPLVRDCFPQSFYSALLTVLPLEQMKIFSDQ